MLGLNPLLAAGLVFLAVSSLLAGTYAIGRRGRRRRRRDQESQRCRRERCP